MKKVVALTACWLLAAPGFAQVSQVFLDQLSVDNGLSQSEVTCILKDRRGYVWLGTQDGLNRYNGYGFTYYKNNPFDFSTLSNDQIASLFEDNAGTLWVGTGNGLNRFDAPTGGFVRLRDSVAAARKYPVLRINALAADAQGTVWAGTNRGLRRILRQPSGGYRLLDHAVGRPDDTRAQIVTALLRDRRGTLWVGTVNGLYSVRVLNPGAPPERQRIAVENAVDPSQPVFWLPNLTVRSLAEDRFGTLWVGTERGLARVDPQTRQIITPPDVAGRLSGSLISSLLVDRRGALWVGTWQEGIFGFWVLNKANARFFDAIREDLLSKKGLKSKGVNVIYEGPDPNEDLVWLGTLNAGAQLYSRAKNSFHPWNPSADQVQSSSGSGLVFAVCTDRHGALWMGSHEGLLRVDRRTGATRRFRYEPGNPFGLRDNVVNALLEDSAGTLWVGTAGGLCRYDRNRERFEAVKLGEPPPMLPGKGRSERIFRLYEDRDHHLWVGTAASLKRLDPRTGQVTAYPVNESEHGLHGYTVEAIQEDDRGNLWVGTGYGLNKLNLRTGKAQFFKNNPADSTSLIGDQILCILRDRRGQLWVCSNKGLSKLRYENGCATFKHYTEASGLPNGLVYGALEDAQGRLWLSTNLGLARFDPLAERFKNYDLSDGLMGNEFNMGAFHRSRDGEFFFGGIGMVVSFHPARLVENRHLPRVVPTSFRVFDQPVPIHALAAQGGEVHLKHHENFFTVEFAALDYTNPQKNGYAYRLEGLSDAWVNNGTRRYVSFSNLPPGQYVLHVRASNGSGLWNEAGAFRLPITIRPPFWQTWWFYALALVTAGLTTWAFYNYRVRKKVKHLLELERVVLQENERVRKMAAQDLHDEFGNTITRISMLTELIKAQLNGRGEEIAPLLAKIGDNSNRLYQGTKDFIWAINPEHDNFYEIAIRLKDFGDDIFDRTGVAFQAHGIADALRTATLPMGASRHLVFLFKEAMSNTLKHAQATQTSLRFAVHGRQIEAAWNDNGRGFQADKPSTGNGLHNIRSRATKIGGWVEIGSPPGGGTEVIFRMMVPENPLPQNG